MKREFLMLAHKYNPKKHNVSGCYISEKLDGTRCFWDGGISRGMKTENVPWANIINPKTGEKKTKIKPVSTGLWSRYANPIIAPDWWLNQLPCIPLDGELWAGRGSFQLCRSICARDVPTDDWHKIEYAVIGSPPLESVFASGEINNPNFLLEVSLTTIKQWMKSRPKGLLTEYRFLPLGIIFENELAILSEALPSEGLVYLHLQKRLPEIDAHIAVERELEKIIGVGGEGIALRHPGSTWVPKRSYGILKYKPFHNAEGTIVGFISGRETDKGLKLQGKIGALILDYKGKRLELSGLIDEERRFNDEAWAVQHPGKEAPMYVEGKYFKRGQVVTFKYRELSDDGIPREARYSRQWSED